MTMPADDLTFLPENDRLPEIIRELLRNRDELRLTSIAVSEDHTEVHASFGGGGHVGSWGFIAVAEDGEQQAAEEYGHMLTLLDGLWFPHSEPSAQNSHYVKKLKPAHVPEPAWWSRLEP